MIYYHGSRNDSLKELTIDHYGGKLYVTDSYPMAVMYAGCSIRNWNYIKEKDLLVLNEVNKDAFKKMYKGRKCYIYTCSVEDAIKDEGNISNHAYIVKHNIQLDEKKEIIEDAFEKILELEKLGKIKLVRWEDLTTEDQELRKERSLNHWKKYIKKEKENFPDEYKLLVDIFPELEIKEEISKNK